MAFDLPLRDNGAGTFDLALSSAGGAITGSATITDGTDALASAGTVTVPTFTGTATITDGTDTVASAATFSPLPATCSANIIDGDDSLSCVVDSGAPPEPVRIFGTGWLRRRPEPSRPAPNRAMQIATWAVGSGIVR